LDDFKFEMKYFCNSKLEALKDLNQNINKNLSFGGIVTNVQHRVAKNGKGWAIFNLEGYDESYEFKIFGEEYMKNRHYLIQNSFTYMKVLVKEGWTDRDTGKKGEPRLQFSEFRMLQDVLENFAKKISILLDIKDLNTEFISRLNAVFQANKGDNQVTFDVLELETIKKQVEVVPEVMVKEEKTEAALFQDEIPEEAAIFTEEISEDEEEPIIVESIVEVLETKVITSLSMPSRKLKIKISNELLVELEKMQINFRLN
jgi:DNA polymerase III subunit alpha